MVLCDRSRMQLKIDASDLTVSVVLKLLCSSCSGLMSPLMLLRLSCLDLSCALCGKQKLSCVLLFNGT